MALFESKPPKAERVDVDRVEKLSEEIARLSGEVRGLRRERDDAKDEVDLSEKVRELTREVTRLEIEKEKVAEKHARAQREVDHKIGLHQKQVTQDNALAKREATVAVQEENLKNAREQFEKDLTFIRERMEKEVERMAKMTDSMMQRLPIWETTRKELVQVGANGNGNGKHSEEGEE